MAHIDSTISLRPLRDQVGGNFMILELDDKYVCKPLQAKETMFYETIPAELKQFTPEYKGILHVLFKREENGEFSYIGRPRNGNGVMSLGMMEESEYKNRQYLRISKQHMVTNGLVETVPSQKDQENGDGSNPWIDFRVRKVDELMKIKDYNGSKQFDYIVLENLTSKFKRPCIMDLKMGTRTYSDDMSEEKKQIHLRKCGTTTSKTLGIRLMGLQTYEVLNEKYHFMDKHDGSGLSDSVLTQTLFDFLHNGERHHVELIPHLLTKLRQLKDVVSRLNGYRMFSSSLLIMYEGSAAAAVKENGSSRPLSKLKQSNDRHESSASVDNNSTPDPSHLNSIIHPDPDFSPSDLVDIRMIDFGNFSAGHDGPDEGYILGLDSIIQIYEKFYMKHRS